MKNVSNDYGSIDVVYYVWSIDYGDKDVLMYAGN